MNSKYSDQDIINVIRKGGKARDDVWEFIYKEWSLSIIKVIMNNGGNKDDAIEMMCEVAIPFEKAIRNPDFKLDSAKLSTYFTKCVYNNWIKKRKIEVRSAFVELEDQHQNDFVWSVEASVIKSDLVFLIDQTLSMIGERCKRILTYFMNGYSMKEIAEFMNFLGEQTAKNEKSKCQRGYEDYLRNNPHILKQILDLRND